jgi:NAD(P)-dependent dehydrogenase (short-subunit alcohol dehydrogenase family)
MRLKGKTAIVTGAGSGIGRAVAERFAEEGATMVLNGRRVEPLLETRDRLASMGAEVIVQPGDVSVRSDCHSVIEAARLAWGRIDVLVNNAAVDQEVAFIDMSEEDWDRVIDINLKGPFLMSQAAARVMGAAEGGSIIHISSIDHFAANGLYSSYNVSKNGLMGLSRCIAVEMAGRNIRSNVVSPGATDTEMMARAAGAELMDYMRERFDRVPMRRLVATREIAQACLFLASEESSGMTGAELVVDGGAVANMYMFETIPDVPAEGAAAPSS